MKVQTTNPFGIYNTKLAAIDGSYYMTIKRKIEKLLDAIIKKFHMEPYVNANNPHKINLNLLLDSPLYKECRDRNGNKLKRGEDYIPTSFDEWYNIQFKDYIDAELIYSEVCRARRITKDDLILLNNICYKYLDEDK